MKSQNDLVPEHVQYPSPLDVEHIGPSNVSQFSKTPLGKGLATQDDTCRCLKGVALSECDTSTCKRKRMDSEDVCDMGLQKKVHVSVSAVPQFVDTVCPRKQVAYVMSPCFPFVPAAGHSNVPITYHSQGSTEIGAGPVTLDFGAGLIRYAATVDADGVGWSDDVVRQLEAAQSSSTATYNPINESCKRRRATADDVSDQRPSQRTRSRTLGPMFNSPLPLTRHQLVTGIRSGTDPHPYDEGPSPQPPRQPAVPVLSTSSSHGSHRLAPAHSAAPQGPTDVCGQPFATRDTHTHSTGGSSRPSRTTRVPPVQPAVPPRARVPRPPMEEGSSRYLFINYLFVLKVHLKNTPNSASVAVYVLIATRYSGTKRGSLAPQGVQVPYTTVVVWEARAYNQMFSMTSLGANIDESVNLGRGPYVFKVSGQIYHRIGKFCPVPPETPRFLQLLPIANFGNNASNVLRPEIVQGLIELLDRHNALVQLFRTARDKLLETDVPDFKIRLFGVVGSTQHELPTADEVGAIVFEGGPESATDFDVVIQRHTGEPERVNKLQPTYMSLHFPLLFIFGEHGYHKDLKLVTGPGDSSDESKRVSMDAYYAYLLHDRFNRNMAEKNMEAPPIAGTGMTPPSDTQTDQRPIDKGKGILVEEDVTNVMNLKPQDLTKPLELKVYRKWASRNVPDPNPTGLCFILLDKQGGAIQANVQLWDIRQFDTKLQVNNCYRIEAYGCKKTERWQRTLENDITLLFGKYTQVTQIADTGFPNRYFNFAAYNQVGQRADGRDPILTDYIGILRDVGTIRESGNSMTNRISRRNIEIQNLNGNTIAFTLWNEQATAFPVNLCSEIQQPPIIAFSSCWAKRFGGGLQLSATPATSYYLNPEIPETDTIRALYQEYMGPLPPLLPPPTEPNAAEADVPGQHMPIRALLEVKPETNAALITNIDESQGWYFNRCRTCQMKIAEGWPHRHCQPPGIRQAPNYTYNFKATLEDDTGSIIVTCFSPQANSLLLPVTEVLSYVPDPDPYTLPPIIKDLQHTRHIFTVHIAPGSRRGNTKFILDHAADVPQLALPDIPTPVEETCSSTTLPQHSPEQVVTELPIVQITPPPQTDDPNEKKEYKPETVSNTVRKELFTQTTNETVPIPMHEIGTTPTQDETTSMPPEEQATSTPTQDEAISVPPQQQSAAEAEDKTATPTTKKAKYE
ncbi:hypothetical protein CTI12_AA489050 [Artemisia annua]|uniref:Uncharacterized protein n=1 Tax=Artemisia annua TaxID=35608 RepID=A0A2U1LHY0_ARTAN|nr:hypothetical protein CTI12_AA489050 [Artemisia annua]